jgi:hypothetical protein
MKPASASDATVHARGVSFSARASTRSAEARTVYAMLAR